MSYCTITEVQGLNPKRTYDVTSKPTSTQVEALITQVAAEIDSILLGRGLTVPVTTPTELVTHLKQVNAYGAAALAEMGMFPEAAGLGATPHGHELWAIYTKMMEWLKTGTLPTATQAGNPRSFFEQHQSDSEPTEDYIWRDAKFGKNKEF